MYRCISAGVAGCPNSEANADYATSGWLPRLISGTDGAGQPVDSPLLSRSTPDEARGQGQQRTAYSVLLAAYFYQCLPRYMHICSRCQTCDTRQDGRSTWHTSRGDARLQSSRARPRTRASPLGSRHVPPRAGRPECQSVNKGCPSVRYRNHRPGDARLRSFF